MSDPSRGIREHYGSAALSERILRALADSGQDVEHLTPEALFPVDQLHGRGLAATQEHLAKLALVPTQHLLDVGSGLGGPARYAASAFGVQVTGVDLTPEFVATAIDLTARVGLAKRVRFECGNALRLPFGAEAFDAASSLYVGMNLANKRGVLDEVYRVLKPGAKLVWSEAVRLSEDPPEFPLPWATEPATSFLVAQATLETALAAADFRVLEVNDETPLLLAYVEQRRSADAANQLSNAVVFGPDFGARVENFHRGLVGGKIGSVLIVAERA